MVPLLHLAQFSHLIFEECHSELCGVFGISRNSIFFMKLISSFDTSTKRGKARDGHFEKNCFRYNHLAGGDYSKI